MLAAADALKPLEEKAAKERQLSGQSADKKAGGRGRKKTLPGTSRKGLERAERESRTRVAKAVGTSARTLEKTRFIKRRGTREEKADDRQALRRDLSAAEAARRIGRTHAAVACRRKRLAGA